MDGRTLLSFTRYRLRSPNLFKTDYGQTAKWSAAAAATAIMMRSDVKEKTEEDVGYVATDVGLARDPFSQWRHSQSSCAHNGYFYCRQAPAASQIPIMT